MFRPFSDSEEIRARYVDYEPLLIVSLLWFLVQFLRFAFPPLFGTLQSEYGVSNAGTGLLFTSLMMAYAVMQFPAGAVSDRIGRPETISVGAFLFSLVGIAVLLAVNFVLLFALVVLLGATTAAHKTVSINLVSNRYPANTGFCLGVLDTVGQFGGVAAPLVAVAFLHSVGWQWTFVMAGTVGVGLAGLNWLRVDDVPTAAGRSGTDSNGDEPTSRVTYADILSNRRLVVFIGVTMTFTFAWNGVSAFLPLYLATETDVSTRLSNLLYSGFFVVSLSQLATGRISDSVGQLWVAVSTFGGMVLTVLFLLVFDGTIIVIVLTLTMGAAFHGFRPVRDSYLMTLIPESIGGGSLGIVRTGMIVVGAASPAVVGFAADASGFTPAFGIILGVLLVGGLLTGVLAVTEAPNGG